MGQKKNHQERNGSTFKNDRRQMDSGQTRNSNGPDPQLHRRRARSSNYSPNAMGIDEGAALPSADVSSSSNYHTRGN